MNSAHLVLSPGLTPGLGFTLMIGTGLVFLAIAFVIKTRLVRNTHDFIISNRRVGLGFGVGAVISVWTWAMAVMMSTAMTYQWGLSGLFWFVVPNGFAVMAMVPLAKILRKRMPAGYTISQFAYNRFNQSRVASGVVTVTMIFGILLEILINLKGTSVVMSTMFPINWEVATILTVVVVLAYSYFGGLWTSVMTGTINTWMITVPAAIVVVAVYSMVDGGATAVFDAVRTAKPSNLSVFNSDAAAGFGITLAFGLLAATVADQTFWQKVWAIRPNQVGRTFLWAGMWFYPIPICLGMLGLVGLGYGLTPDDFGGDIVAVGPYIVSHIGLPLFLVIAYVLAILAACYSTIDGASSALSSIVAVDIVKRYMPQTPEIDAVLRHQAVHAGGRHRGSGRGSVRNRLHHTGADDLRVENLDPLAANLCHRLVTDDDGRLCRRCLPVDPDRDAAARDVRRADGYAVDPRHQRRLRPLTGFLRTRRSTWPTSASNRRSVWKVEPGMRAAGLSRRAGRSQILGFRNPALLKGNSTMSTLELAFYILGAIATLIFVAGYIRGTRRHSPP